MPDWRAVLIGDEFDLAALAEAYPTGDPRVVREEHGTHVKFAELDQVDDPKLAQSKAEELVRLLNGTARLALGDGFDPVTSGGAYRMRQDGGRDIFAADTMTGRARFRAVAQVVNADGSPAPSPPSPLPGFFEAAQRETRTSRRP